MPFAYVRTAGNLTLGAYEDDYEFADPAGSFRGLQRFKRNCTNFGSLLEKSNMKLTRWEDVEVHFPCQSVDLYSSKVVSCFANSSGLLGAGQIDRALAFQLRHVVPVEAHSLR